MLKSDIFFLFIPVLLGEGSIDFLRPLPIRVEASLYDNVTLSCAAVGERPLHTLWTKDGQPIVDRATWTLAHQGELHLSKVHREDAGRYTCIVQNPRDKQTLSTTLVITAPPGRLANVSVYPSMPATVATISWHPGEAGGAPIVNFSLLYHQVEPFLEPVWRHPVPRHLSPVMRQVDIFNLKPNCSYELKMWANNRVGSGEPTYIHFTTIKPADQLELVRHMLAGSDEYTVTAWVLAVSLVMGTIVMLCIASCWLIYKDWKHSLRNGDHYYEDSDHDELLRHMMMNPQLYDEQNVADDDLMFMEQADENFNSQHSFRFYNNNSVINPCRV